MEITGRIRELERPARSIEPFLYQTPIQCAGVTVRRTSYEALGGFRLDMGYVTDCEMWARVTAAHGGVVSPKIKASFRIGHGSESNRALRTAEGIKDISRLNDLFAQQYPTFSVERGRARVSEAAWQGYWSYTRKRDNTAASANWEVWAQLTPAHRRLARYVGTYIREGYRLGVVGTASRLINKAARVTRSA
jgi:hypothetical protein